MARRGTRYGDKDVARVWAQARRGRTDGEIALATGMSVPTVKKFRLRDPQPANPKIANPKIAKLKVAAPIASKPAIAPQPKVTPARGSKSLGSGSVWIAPDEAARDLDEHPSAYFRQLKSGALYSAEREVSAAKAMRDLETACWRTIFEHKRGSVAQTARALLTAAYARRVAARFNAGPAAVAADDSRMDVDLRLPAHPARAAARARAADLDRLVLDSIVADLRRRVTAQVPAPTQADRAFVAQLTKTHSAAVCEREAFTHANLRLVIAMAKKIHNPGIGFSDLIQEGNLGLMHAVPRFDYRRGVRFSTFACWWIRHALMRAIADKAKTVRVPVHVFESSAKLRRRVDRLRAELGREPEREEIAAACGVTLKRLRAIEGPGYWLTGSSDSLDQPVFEDGSETAGDFIADPAGEDASPIVCMVSAEERDLLRAALRTLSPMEADVLAQRFGLGRAPELTLAEIATPYGLTRERIRQIETKAIARLRSALRRPDVLRSRVARLDLDLEDQEKAKAKIVDEPNVIADAHATAT